MAGWGKVLFPVTLDLFRSFFAFNNEKFGVLTARYLRTLVDVVFKRLFLNTWTYFIVRNKNRQKAIFNWAAKGLFFLRGGGGYTHSGYHKTSSATIACDRTSCETET